MTRYVCVHGHFYQPPRENPWLEAVEVEDSAAPYHDWNERVTAEAYAPNAASRILDAEGRIARIVNNYGRISFNVGPTLLSWLEAHSPDVYRAILDADRESAARRSGHGNAIAQVYGHVIMPLANARDRRTQVVWGMRDFERRFGRRPEGMWLPETAVDLDTLDALAGEGVRFTILAPHQAARVRRLAGGAWHDVSGGRIDTTRAYVQRLPSGRSIALFFYDGPISQAVAFEDLLRDGGAFAARLVAGFSADGAGPQLVHVATDGETFGHHHRFGDMALAYALHHIEAEGLAQITNYGEYLDRHPPAYLVEIAERTSWSCPHGVERWRSDCGCNAGRHPGWRQAWRAPLREALDWLRDALAPRYERAGLLRDPWAARDDYVEVILDRSPEHVDRFLARHAGRPLDAAERVRALKLLEMQRQALLMYASCGWFFDEISDLETVQVMQHAGRAAHLAGELFGEDVEAGLLDRLARAPSNLPEMGGGRRIYERLVRPAMVTWERLAAHYAIRSLFDAYPEHARIYCYRVDRRDGRTLDAGRARLAVGRAALTSEITGESAEATYGVLHLGDHTVSGGVGPVEGDEAYAALERDLTGAFARADFPEVIRLLDRHFGGATYSLRSLFRDEQRRILDRILGEALAEAESLYGQIYERRAALMHFLADLGAPLPRAFRVAAEFVLNSRLRAAIGAEEPDPDRVRALLDEAKAGNVPLDADALGFALTRAIERVAGRLAADPDDLVVLRRLETLVSLSQGQPFQVNLWTPQNRFYDLLRGVYPEFHARAAAGDGAAREWLDRFTRLGGLLWVRVDPPPVPAPA